jgi:hypothetical protein
MIVAPTASYQLTLPDDVSQDKADETVSSFWMPGGHCLLQLSSYARTSGEQVSAAQRLQERVERTGGLWEPITGFEYDRTKDFAASSNKKIDGWTWKHIYLSGPTWPYMRALQLLHTNRQTRTNGLGKHLRA